jgi:flagellar hook assembly protein FlgD
LLKKKCERKITILASNNDGMIEIQEEASKTNKTALASNNDGMIEIQDDGGKTKEHNKDKTHKTWKWVSFFRGHELSTSSMISFLLCTRTTIYVAAT